MLAAVRWLLLDAPECRGTLKSSEAVIVASYSCWKETHVSGRKVDRRVLATGIDAELGLINCVRDRIGQMTRRFIVEQQYTGA